jgi:fructose-1,6-bisphosphatase
MDIYDSTIMGIVAGSVGLLGFFVRKQFTKVDDLIEKKADKKDIREIIDDKIEVLRIQDATIKEDIKEIKEDVKEIKTCVNKLR